MSPDTHIELAKATAPRTPAIVNAVSENGSFTKVWSLFPITATSNPITIPPKNTKRKYSKLPDRVWISPIPKILFAAVNDSVTKDGEKEEFDPYTKTTTDENNIIVVASLNEDSISRILASSFGTFVLLNVCMTIAASVEEINDAKRKLKEKGKWITYIIIRPIIRVDITTPIVDKSRTEVLTGLYSL